MSVEVTINGQPREIDSSWRLSDLLKDLGLDARPVAVEVNRELAPRAKHASHLLKPGDELEIVTLVGGG